MSENEDSGPLAVFGNRFLMAICPMAVFFYSTVASSQHLHFFTVRSPAALAVKLTSGFGPWVRCVGQVHVARRPGRCGASTRFTEFHAYLQNLFICKTRTGRPLVFAIRFWNLRLLKSHWARMGAKSGLIQVGVGCERAKPQR